MHRLKQLICSIFKHQIFLAKLLDTPTALYHFITLISNDTINIHTCNHTSCFSRIRHRPIPVLGIGYRPISAVSVPPILKPIPAPIPPMLCAVKAFNHPTVVIICWYLLAPPQLSRVRGCLVQRAMCTVTSAHSWHWTLRRWGNGHFPTGRFPWTIYQTSAESLSTFRQQLTNHLFN